VFEYLKSVQVKEKDIPVFNYVIKYYAMKTYGEWRYSSTILNLGTGWR
jgi:hypothetical protein